MIEKASSTGGVFLRTAGVDMQETGLSLLDCLRSEPSEVSWRRLRRYSPLIRGWLVRRGVTAQDADDVVQEILVVVLRKLPQFERAPRAGAFRRNRYGRRSHAILRHFGD